MLTKGLISFQSRQVRAFDGDRTDNCKSYFVLIETNSWAFGVGFFNTLTARLAVGWRKLVWLCWGEQFIQLRVLCFCVRYKDKEAAREQADCY